MPTYHELVASEPSGHELAFRTEEEFNVLIDGWPRTKSWSGITNPEDLERSARSQIPRRLKNRRLLFRWSQEDQLLDYWEVVLGSKRS